MKRTHPRWTPEVENQLHYATLAPPGAMQALADALGVGLNILCRHARRKGWTTATGRRLLKSREEHLAGVKTCTRCGKTKPLSDFFFTVGRKSPQSGKCRLCIVASRRDTLRSNLARTRAYRIGNISIDSLEALYDAQNGRCHYSGLKMDLSDRETCPSADRVDSAKPYALDNIVLCCYRVNMMKNVASYESFIRFCNRVAKLHPRGTPEGEVVSLTETPSP